MAAEKLFERLLAGLLYYTLKIKRFIAFMKQFVNDFLTVWNLKIPVASSEHLQLLCNHIILDLLEQLVLIQLV